VEQAALSESSESTPSTPPNRVLRPGAHHCNRAPRGIQVPVEVGADVRRKTDAVPSRRIIEADAQLVPEWIGCAHVVIDIAGIVPDREVAYRDYALIAPHTRFDRAFADCLLTAMTTSPVPGW
jgi:hypothetical protein